MFAATGKVKMKKSQFYDLFNRHRETDLDAFLRTHTEDEDFILWNGYVIPNDFGDPEAEYQAIRNSCALFDVTPIRKYEIRGIDAGAFLDGLLTRPVRDAMGIELPGYGITALEACRIEGGFIVPDWDCATELEPHPGFERSPFELGVGWLVDLNAADFIGRSALSEKQASGPRFVIRRFLIETQIKPEAHAALYATIDGRTVEIGTMPCHTYSWGLQRMIGNASIHFPYAGLEEAWTVLGEERFTVTLKRGRLVDLPRRTQTPALIHGDGA